MTWQVTLPRAVQLVIDDVGWREGWRLDEQGGPYRAGIDRLLGPDDYAAIADLGRSLGIRPTAAMILCEWDRENTCARYPTTTQPGAAWDNSKRAGDWSDEAAGIFRERSANLELALHGVGHEHWSEGAMTRAEWHTHTGRRWAWEVLQGHLECFRALLDQHDLGTAAGHRLPLDFIPCAFCYLYDDQDDQDTGALVASGGVQVASTPFSCLDRHSPLLAADGFVDHGVLVLDRGSNGVPWHAVDQIPDQIMGECLDVDESALDLAEHDSQPLTPDEQDLYLARRALNRSDDRQKLVDAHRPLVAAVARLNTARGLTANDLIDVGEQALRDAIQTFDSERGVEFEVYAEARVRRAIQQALAAAAPLTPAVVADPGGSICGVHWPNLLSANPADNAVAVNHWTAYLRQVGDQPGQLLAANARECFAQWAWRTFGRLEPLDDGFHLDLTAVPAAVWAIVGEWPVIVEVGAYRRVGRPLPGPFRPVWYRRQGSRAFVAVRAAAPVAGDLTFDAAAGPLQPAVYREDTYSVLDLAPAGGGLRLEVEVYGTQTITLAPGFEPGEVTVEAGRLRILARRDNPALGTMALRVAGHDLQGERGSLVVRQKDPRGAGQSI